MGGPALGRTDVRYLLHLWHANSGPWRASLRDLCDGALAEFADLGELVSFLRATTTVAEEPALGAGEGGPDGGGEDA